MYGVGCCAEAKLREIKRARRRVREMRLVRLGEDIVVRMLRMRYELLSWQKSEPQQSGALL